MTRMEKEFGARIHILSCNMRNSENVVKASEALADVWGVKSNSEDTADVIVPQKSVVGPSCIYTVIDEELITGHAAQIYSIGVSLKKWNKSSDPVIVITERLESVIEIYEYLKGSLTDSSVLKSIGDIDLNMEEEDIKNFLKKPQGVLVTNADMLVRARNGQLRNIIKIRDLFQSEDAAKELFPQISSVDLDCRCEVIDMELSKDMVASIHLVRAAIQKYFKPEDPVIVITMGSTFLRNIYEDLKANLTRPVLKFARHDTLEAQKNISEYLKKPEGILVTDDDSFGGAQARNIVVYHTLKGFGTIRNAILRTMSLAIVILKDSENLKHVEIEKSMTCDKDLSKRAYALVQQSIQASSAEEGIHYTQNV